ncbi:MAG: hypothetical protein GY752_09065 [bacterium]|nr:hypothetical protein [bacterium]MCP4800503.1 hypothetical protein [bacterium]
MKLANMLWSLVNHPTLAMESVASKPQLLIASLLVAIMSGLFLGVVMDVMIPEILNMQLESLSAAEARKAAQDMEVVYDFIENPALWVRIAVGVLGGIASVITVLITGLIFFFVGKIVGGMGSLAQIQGVVMWANVIGTGFSSLFKMPVVLAKGSLMEVNFSPAILLANMDPQNTLYQFLSIFDFFSIWMLVIIIIGLQKVHSFPRNKAVLVTVFTWFAMSSFSILLAGLQ